MDKIIVEGGRSLEGAGFLKGEQVKSAYLSRIKRGSDLKCLKFWSCFAFSEL